MLVSAFVRLGLFVGGGAYFGVGRTVVWPVSTSRANGLP